MTVPPPPAVPGELIEKAVRAVHLASCCPLDSASPCTDDFEIYAPERGMATAVLSAVYGDIVEAARRDALDQAIAAIEVARIEHTEGIGNPTGAIYRTAMDRAARIVTDLRDATLRSAP